MMMTRIGCTVNQATYILTVDSQVQDVRHLFACNAHPTDLSPEDLWRNPVGSIREFSYHDDLTTDLIIANNNMFNFFSMCSNSVFFLNTPPELVLLYLEV